MEANILKFRKDKTHVTIITMNNTQHKNKTNNSNVLQNSLEHRSETVQNVTTHADIMGLQPQTKPLVSHEPQL